MHFIQRISFDYIFTEIRFWWSNWREVNIGLGNGLVPNRQQAIIGTIVDQDLLRILASLGHID